MTVRRIGAVVCVSLGTLLPMCGLAQVNAAFDVASIKVNRSGSVNASMRTSHGHLSARNVTVRMLVQAALRVKDFQVTGGPSWAAGDRFDVEAKTDRTDISDDDLWLLLQPLLTERFHLKLHHETKQLPVYSLVVGRDRPKLQVHTGDEPPSTRVSAGSGKVVVAGKNVTLARFADSLSGWLDRTVVDNTGLKDRYDLRLEWYQEHPGDPSPSMMGAVEERMGISGPSIFTAVQEQLGLRLDATKGPVEIIVIDGLDRPTEN